jgi:hypothetical protein
MLAPSHPASLATNPQHTVDSQTDKHTHTQRERERERDTAATLRPAIIAQSMEVPIPALAGA